MKIDVARPRELGETERSAWASFRAADPELANPFFTASWARIVSDARPDARVAILHENGAICGFLPVAGGAGRLLGPLGGPLSDYQALIADPATACPVRVLALLRALGADRIDWPHALASQAALGPYLRPGHVSHLVDLSGGFEAWVRRRRAAGGRIDKRLRQRARALETAYGSLRLEPFSRDPAVFERLLLWKREQYARTRQPDIFKTRWIDQVVRQTFATDEPGFGGALFALYAGARLLAVHYALRSERVLHAWFIAHDPEAHDHSPGLVLLGEMIAHLADGRFDTLDLGPGDYRFKTEFATDTRPLGEACIGRPSPSVVFRKAQLGVRDRIARLPAGAFAQAPAKALRRLDFIRWLTPPHGGRP